MTPLSSARRSELRAQAHRLNPVVLIGDKGLTDEVLAEIDRALKAHELIKVRAATDDRDARSVWMESICGKLAAHPVQQIGKILVIYREKPKEERPQAGPRSPRPAGRAEDDGKRRASGAGVKRTSRPRSRTPSPPRESGPRRRRPRTSR